MRRGLVVLVCSEGRVLDRVRISDVRQKIPDGILQDISGVSLDASPREKVGFCVVEGGWARLFPDPMTELPVYGTRIPVFQLIETNHS